MAARAPRCRWKPVMCSSTSSAATKTGTSAPSPDPVARLMSGVRDSSHRADIRKDRGRCPARMARSMTLADSAMYSPRSGSIFDRSLTSLRRV